MRKTQAKAKRRPAPSVLIRCDQFIQLANAPVIDGVLDPNLIALAMGR